ncbi:unnamed protein product [Polarella glacialis]|uniref:Uncharacterized protein n=1 Tax=Polarella glacialis TaxID=89957 RepID=A0A813HUG6_POLGL|nr:unnamed protein product [Polarella glacialis]CAE8641373.1 unnamed protein product [Polarella glacialis]
MAGYPPSPSRGSADGVQVARSSQEVFQLLASNAQRIRCNFSHISVQDARTLRQRLAQDSGLKHLDLCYCEVGPEASCVLADGLRQNTSLQHLALGWGPSLWCRS